MEPENKEKLFFSLSPRATLINALILMAASQLFWVFAFVKQYVAGSAVQPDVQVPWYYDMPFAWLSLWMTIAWVQYTFKIPKADMSWKAIRYKYLYVIGFYVIYSAMVRFILAMLLFPILK